MKFTLLATLAAFALTSSVEGKYLAEDISTGMKQFGAEFQSLLDLIDEIDTQDATPEVLAVIEKADDLDDKVEAFKAKMEEKRAQLEEKKAARGSRQTGKKGKKKGKGRN